MNFSSFIQRRAHEIVRKMVVTQLLENSKQYEKFILADYHYYCSNMGNLTVWGDNVTLQAASDVFGVRINLITSIKETVLIQITPAVLKSSKVLWLSFLSQTHFNSLYSPNSSRLLSFPFIRNWSILMKQH